MNPESSPTSTNGGSLPRLSAELLWFECHEHGAPDRAVAMPGGDVVFAHRGAVCAMPEPEWLRFRAFQQPAV